MDENGNPVVHRETEVSGFTKFYLADLPEGSLPPVGALMVWDTKMDGSGGAGHIAIVTSVDPANGTITVVDGNSAREEITVDEEVRNIGVGSVHVIRDMSRVIGWMVPNTSQSE